MKFDNSKQNIKELGRDFQAVGVGLVGIATHTLLIPVAFCKDIRDSYLNSKLTKKPVEKSTEKSKKTPEVVAAQ